MSQKNSLSSPIELYSLLPGEVKEHLEEKGFARFKGKEVLKWAYQGHVDSFEKMTTLSKEERKILQTAFILGSFQVKTHHISQDKTHKILYELSDGRYVESVLIPDESRLTLCVSTQVGCPVKCIFCASGILGLRRNLTVAEMVGQFVESARRASPQRITNVVVMGMGEPFLNFENLMRALQILQSPECIGLGIRKITLSTVGLKGFIEKIFTAPIHPRLAISLHAPTDELRKELIPFPRILTIDEILVFLDEYTRKKISRVTLEYVFLKGKNTHPELAHILGKKFSHLPVRVNLIPFNPVESLPYEEPSLEEIKAFVNILDQYKISSTVRGRHGDAIQAACGQLRLKEEMHKK